MAEENNVQYESADSSDIQIDMDMLQQQEKTITSLCDKYGIHIFNEKAALLEDEALREKEEQRERILADVLSGTKNSDREETVKKVMSAETSAVIKKEYEAETVKDQDLSVYAFGAAGMLMAGIFLFYIEDRRKKKRKRERGYEADNNHYGYAE